MKNILLALALFMFLLPSNAQSMQPISITEEECQEIWDTLWSKVEDGDIKARLEIVGHMWGSGLELPGRSRDYLTRLRDIYILTAHSIELIEENDGFFDSYLNEIKAFASKEFGECMEKNRSKACTEILVDNQRIPPFQNYIDEVNALIAAGNKPTCPYNPELEIFGYEVKTPQNKK